MRSRLHVSACLMQQKTILKDVYCEAPCQVMLPFYDGDWMETVLMSSSAGIFGGDHFESLYEIEKGTRVRVKSQSYEKVFQRKEQPAVKKVQIQVAEDAKCVYLPYPVIPFAKSRYECGTNVHLQDSSTFLYGDIFNCGRVGMKEQFEMEYFHSCTNIYIGERLVFADNTYIDPARWNYNRLGLWHGYTHNGMLYIHFPEESQEKEFLTWFRDWSKDTFGTGENENSPVYWGSTRCLSGIAIRILGLEGDFIYQAFENIAKRIQCTK